MQFSVYLLQQDAFNIGTVPPHSCSRKNADWFVLRGIARRVGQNAIQLVRDISWKQAKELLPKKANPDDFGILNQEGYHTVPYTYPLPYEILRHYRSA